MFFCIVQTCLTSPTCVGKWQSSASSRQFTDSGRTSSVPSTSPRETFPACRFVCRLFIYMGFFLNINYICVHLFQYSVSLQNEEEIQQQYQRRPGQVISVTGHGRHMESCLHTASSHFSLPVPLNVTPGFSTDIGRSSVGRNTSNGKYNVINETPLCFM